MHQFDKPAPVGIAVFFLLKWFILCKRRGLTCAFIGVPSKKIMKNWSMFVEISTHECARTMFLCTYMENTGPNL